MKHLTTFAHENKIEVVAEGVETDAEVKMCLGLGADYLQGFGILRPTPNWNQKINVDPVTRAATLLES
jgi:EAL domain-containing protein (putative c-di-GMP-specific phosphodiesterase class I)